MADQTAVWHPQHVIDLERAFPERTGLDDAEVMAYERGQRSVLAHIAMLIQQRRAKVQEGAPHGVA